MKRILIPLVLAMTLNLLLTPFNDTMQGKR